MKKIFTILLLVIGLFIAFKITSAKPQSVVDKQTNHENPDLVLYWGTTCPHCKIVEDYIQENQIDEKLKINRKEVYENKQNLEELENMVNNTCKELNNGGIGVPLALDVKGNQCIQGDQPIIDFIVEKTGQKE